MQRTLSTRLALMLGLAQALAAAAAAAGDVRSLAAAPASERTTIQKLLGAGTWPRRAIATVRLERFGCDESRQLLVELMGDGTWQVRAFAVATLGRRREPLPPGWLAGEEDARVLRTVLRHRYTMDVERLGRGIRNLAGRRDLEDKMLAVELAATTADPELHTLARETIKTIVLRMTRPQAGVLSPRLAAVTGAWDARTPQRWQRWLRKAGRSYTLRGAFTVPEAPAPVEPTLLASLETGQFASLRDYIDELQGRSVDLAIVIDTTASMWGELAAAQGGIDDLMLFVGDVVGELRVGIVAYRDRGNRYQTRGWDFTSDIELARSRLWQLTASEGGDAPEAVEPALRQAFRDLDWVAEHTKVLVLIGDAPPHPGTGTHCVRMATLAHQQSKLVTHVIQADGKKVRHFEEIAEAGKGQCVNLDDDDALIPEISGLTLGERFGDEIGEFFRMYLAFGR